VQGTANSERRKGRGKSRNESGETKVGLGKSVWGEFPLGGRVHLGAARLSSRGKAKSDQRWLKKGVCGKRRQNRRYSKKEPKKQTKLAKRTSHVIASGLHCGCEVADKGRVNEKWGRPSSLWSWGGRELLQLAEKGYPTTQCHGREGGDRSGWDLVF